MIYVIALTLGICVNSLAFQCGKPKIPPKTFYTIVGGEEAVAHSWPWQSLIINVRNDIICGASIISRYWLLAASHCYSDAAYWKSPKPTIVRVGIHNKDVNVTKYQTDFSIAKIFFHSKYNYSTNDNDIALVKLREPIVFNSNIQPICLPKAGDNNYLNNVCYITGWGHVKRKRRSLKLKKRYATCRATRDGSTASDCFSTVLRQLAIPVLTYKECSKNKIISDKITENMFCAGFLSGKGDSCEGDSGGPLVCQNNNYLWIQYGIISWGYGCATVGFPGIYTNISRYLNWITNIINNNRN